MPIRLAYEHGAAIWRRRFGTAKRRPFKQTFRSSREGAVAVEFALIGMIFFALMLATFEVALVAFAEQILAKATQKAARTAQIGFISNNTGGEAAFRQAVCDDTFGFFDCDQLRIRVTVFDDFAAASVQLNDPLPDDLADFETFDAGEPEEIVVFRVLYEWPILLLDPSRSLGNRGDGNRLLVSTIVVRNEPNAES